MTAAAKPRSSTTAACATSGHPLELFPVFRRIPRSIPRDIVYTLIWNTLFTLGVHGAQHPVRSVGPARGCPVVDIRLCELHRLHHPFRVRRLRSAVPGRSRARDGDSGGLCFAAGGCRRVRRILARHRNPALPRDAGLDLLAARHLFDRWNGAADLDAAADDLHPARARGPHGGGLRTRAFARRRRRAGDYAARGSSCSRRRSSRTSSTTRSPTW